MTVTQVKYAIDRQLTPTRWERVFVQEDGAETLQFAGTLAEVLDSWLPLVIPKTWNLGCKCGEDGCPTPEEPARRDRGEFIAQFVEIHKTWMAQPIVLHLDVGCGSACGYVQPDDIPGHTKTRLVQFAYWHEWVGKQCPRCNARGVPYFLKQLGGHTDKRGGDKVLDGELWHQMPEAK